MTNQEILTKAIQKAIDGGWEEILNTETWKVDKHLRTSISMCSPYTGNEIYGRYEWQEIVYRHDFAKALWGDWDIVETGKLYNSDGTLDSGQTITAFAGKIWQYHLQNMVIADDPIAYLGEHI